MSKKNKLGIGVDIGTRSIRVATLRSTGKGIVVERIASKEIPHEAIVDGLTMDSELLCGQIAELLSETKIKGKEVAISVGGRQVMIKKIETDEMSDDELESAIEYEANTNLPFKLDEVTLDYARMHQEIDDGSMQVLLVAAKKEVVFDQVENLHWAGGKSRLLEAEPFALQAALIEAGYLEDESVVAAMQIGFQSTDVTIFENMQFEVNRNLSNGGKSYIEGLIRELGITFEKAAGLLAKKQRTEEEQAALARVTRQVCQSLVERVERGFPESFGPLADKPVTKIVLCGGGATLPGIRESLSEKFDVEVEIAEPFRNFDAESIRGILAENDSGNAYTSAIGLALRAMGDRYPGFNLLFPADRPEAKRAAHLGAQTVLPIVGLSALLLIIGVIHIGQETRLTARSVRLKEIRAETDLYRDKIAMVEDLTRKRADISARIDVIRELDKNRFARVALMSLVNRNVPSLTWITSVKESKAGGNTVLISGVTQSNIKVADFMTQLLQESAVRGVDLLVSQQSEIGGVDVTQFTLQATIPMMILQEYAKEKPENQIEKGAQAIREKRAAVDQLQEQSKH
ncbi:type IV pilus assembly protein PilM [bacterium]|nr:type IV pilus assembly protein PilM [bacterium]MBU1637622.1 type IV pilus assembly protein PilM [bacterium]